MTVGIATVEVVPDLKKFGVALDNDLSGSTAGAGRRAGTTFGNALKVGFLAVGAGAAVLSAFGVSAVNAASDLGETLSKTEAVFGSAAEGPKAFAEASAAAFGLSERAALDFQSAFGLNLQNIGGLSTDAAAGLAGDLTGLTSDLASFFNANTDDVATALNSALTGEFEPLKKFGIVINDATLKQKALELGLYDGVGALDAQAKQAATTALIFEGTTQAQGDFARTSGGLANQQRILSARFENLKATLGQKLLPIAVRVASFLNDNFPRASALASRAIEAIKTAVDNIRGPVLSVLSALQSAFGFLQNNQEIVIAAASGIAAVLVVAFASWAIAAGTAAIATIAAAAPLIAVGLAIAAVAAGFVYAYQEVEFFRTAVDAVVAFVTGTVVPIVVTLATAIGETLASAASNAMAIFNTVVLPAFFAIKDTITGTVIPGIASLITKFGEIATKVQTVVTNVKTYFDDVVTFITGLPARIATAASGMWDGIKSAFSSMVNGIKALWNDTVGGFSFTIPSWVPGVGGSGFTIPTLHTGGMVPGQAGSEHLYLLEAGELVISASDVRSGNMGGNGAGRTVNYNISSQFADTAAFTDTARESVRREEALNGSRFLATSSRGGG